MKLYALHILCDGTLTLSYYFGKAPILTQDSFEVELSRLLKVNPLRKDTEWCACARGKPVVARLHQNFAFVLAGSPDTDELALSETLPFIIQLVVETCDGKLTAAQLVAFQGKVIVVLHEACPQGQLRCTDVPTILRNAKLKAPSL